jgi:DNA-binding MarR family transcriptional regulator
MLSTAQIHSGSEEVEKMAGGRISARFAYQGLPPKKPYRVLGHRAFQVLAFIKAKLESEGFPPSYRIIGDELGIERGNVHRIVVHLERRGEIVRAERRRDDWHAPRIRLAGS